MHEAKQTVWSKRVAFAAASTACGLFLASCATDLGKCDMTMLGGSDMSGTANTGQTVVNNHCAGGRCHSALATGKLRYGAPAGLNFDAVVNGTAPGTSTLDIVMHGISKIKDEADELWGAASEGEMPPKGQGSLTSAEKEQMRNWLACGAPAVTAVQGGGATADWTSIYTSLSSSSCFVCHSASSSAAGMGFSLGDMGDQCAAYAAVVSKQSVTPLCMGKGLTLVVPGHPESSFMVQKLKGTQTCGASMPQGAMPLAVTNATTVTALEQWIMAGAPKPAACP